MTSTPTPTPSSKEAQVRMRAMRRRDTSPEIAIRRELHARGRRYRVDTPPLPGLRRRADLVFGAAQVAVFVDGCFWHGCPEHGTWPKANSRWWRSKIQQNIERDRDTDRTLSAAGWKVVRVWEHDDPVAAADRIEGLLEDVKRPPGIGSPPR